MEKEKSVYDYISNNKLEIEEIVNDYSNYIETIIRNGANFREEDIEEVISDVFVALWNNQEKLDYNKRLTPYIAGITNNLIKKRYRDLKYDLKYNENIESFAENLVISENFILFDDTYEKNSLLLAELNKLKPENQEIFTMFYFENRKIKDIANMLGFKESKVKMNLNRTRKKLKKILKEGGEI